MQANCTYHEGVFWRGVEGGGGSKNESLRGEGGRERKQREERERENLVDNVGVEEEKWCSEGDRVREREGSIAHGGNVIVSNKSHGSPLVIKQLSFTPPPPPPPPKVSLVYPPSLFHTFLIPWLLSLSLHSLSLFFGLPSSSTFFSTGVMISPSVRDAYY